MGYAHKRISYKFTFAYDAFIIPSLSYFQNPVLSPSLSRPPIPPLQSHANPHPESQPHLHPHPRPHSNPYPHPNSTLSAQSADGADRKLERENSAIGSRKGGLGITSANKNAPPEGSDNLRSTSSASKTRLEDRRTKTSESLRPQEMQASHQMTMCNIHKQMKSL